MPGNQSSCSKTTRKFVRSTNFSKKEENILLAIVKKYRNEIECKNTDRNIKDIKKQAWMKVAREFNMASGETARDETTLKNKYENIKKRSKEKFADHKNYMTGTGGGASEDICITTTDNAIMDIIGSQMTGNNSDFDDDFCGESIILNFSDGDEPIVSQIVENQNTETETQSNSQWLAADSAFLLKTPKSNFLKVGASVPVEMNHPNTSTKITPIRNSQIKQSVSKKELENNKSNETLEIKTPLKKKLIRNAGFGYKAEEWAKSKVALEEAKKQYYKDEHMLKLKHMTEKHAKELALMENNAQEKRKWEFEEHKERLEVLRLEKEVLQRKLNNE